MPGLDGGESPQPLAALGVGAGTKDALVELALALQVALLVPLLAGLPGLINGFRMMRRPDPAPSSAAELALS